MAIGKVLAGVKVVSALVSLFGGKKDKERADAITDVVEDVQESGVAGKIPAIIEAKTKKPLNPYVSAILAAAIAVATIGGGYLSVVDPEKGARLISAIELVLGMADKYSDILQESESGGEEVPSPQGQAD